MVPLCVGSLPPVRGAFGGTEGIMLSCRGLPATLQLPSSNPSYKTFLYPTAVLYNLPHNCQSVSLYTIFAQHRDL